MTPTTTDTWINSDGSLGVFCPAAHGLPALIVEVEDWAPEDLDYPPVRRGSLLDDILYYALVVGLVLMCLAAPVAYVITHMNCDSRGGDHYSVVMCRVSEAEPFIYRTGTKP